MIVTQGGLGPDREPEGLDLAAWIDHQAAYYRGLDLEAGDLVARMLAELASTVRLVHARTPGQAAHRIARMEREHARGDDILLRPTAEF